MKVQKGIIAETNRECWLVLDDDYQPVEPICKYLNHLDNLERSPNTISLYAYNLRLYWEFLKDKLIDWKQINLERLADFIHWLRNPKKDTILIALQKSPRCEKTINNCLTTVWGFYDFHQRMGTLDIKLDVYAYESQQRQKRRYKPFLYDIAKNKDVKTRLLKIKEPKTLPRCLTAEQVKNLISACNNWRDKFLLRLLYESGLRIGEALGLRHEDMITGNDNKIKVVPRHNNQNNVRAKGGVRRTVHVSKELMQWYTAYLIDEYPEDIDCDYVFIVIKEIGKGKIGEPLKYKTIDSLFRRLSKKTVIKITPHMLRHTHATELIRAGWDMAYVQKRLGHSDVQTTINTYVHLTEEDMMRAYVDYLNKKEEL